MGKQAFFISFVIVAALVATVAWVEPAFAADTTTGEDLLTDVQGLIGGKLGTVIGLGVSLFGLWVWLAQQSSWGLLILIAGAALTAFPGLYGSLADAIKTGFSNTLKKGSGTVGTYDAGHT